MTGIAFHAPMKPPDSPVPSGDRLMARQLFACLEHLGPVTLASRLATRLRDPGDHARHAQIMADAGDERVRLTCAWTRDGPPALWVCYHPYYKTPDLIGPPLCAQFDVPYVTIEASYSARRDIGLWVDWQARAVSAIRQAALNICLTGRDRAGLVPLVGPDSLANLAPFIDAQPWTARTPTPEPGHIGVVAMMRAGDKADSYGFLAAALAHLDDAPWRLSVIGDGLARDAVMAVFADLPAGRVTFLGALAPDAVAAELSRMAIFAWPGMGEAYGLAYLEAQAAGVPVVALNTAGVPEVVRHGETGFLCPPGDPHAYAAALRTLLCDEARRGAMATAARRRVLHRHDLGPATVRLRSLLTPLMGARE